MGSTIELNHINKAFLQGTEKVNILEDINLEFYAGETIAILGPSGSGKSTLLNILGLLSEPDSGEYFLDGIATDGLSRAEISAIRLHKIAFVFQTFHLVDYKNVLSNEAYS